MSLESCLVICNLRPSCLQKKCTISQRSEKGLTIFAKSSIVDIWLDFKYAPAFSKSFLEDLEFYVVAYWNWFSSKIYSTNYTFQELVAYKPFGYKKSLRNIIPQYVRYDNYKDKGYYSSCSNRPKHSLYISKLCLYFAK